MSIFAITKRWSKQSAYCLLIKNIDMDTTLKLSPRQISYQARQKGKKVEQYASELLADYQESMEVASFMIENPECLEPASEEEQAEFFAYMTNLLNESKRI